MTSLFCHRCQTIHDIGTDAIRSVHATSHGRIAYVTCPVGHTVVVDHSG